MDVTLSVSCSTDRDSIRRTPISGKLSIHKDNTMPGTWTKSVTVAKTDAVGKSPSAGDICSQYGAGGSGRGIITQVTKAKDGGTTGTPYKQEIYTIVGAM